MRQTNTFIHVLCDRFLYMRDSVAKRNSSITTSVNQLFLGFSFRRKCRLFKNLFQKNSHTHEKKRTKRGGSPLTRHMGQSANSHINIESKRYVKMLTKPKTVCIFGLSCGNGSYFVRHKSGTRSHTVMLLSFGATDESERKNIMIIYWEEMRWNLKRNYFWKRMKK